VLKAPLQLDDGSLVERDRGTPQGSAISPLLANVFLHYAFDLWMAREHRLVLFERYCDDVIVHARSERHARELRAAIASRLAECGLELNEQKTRIVYCKDWARRGSYQHECSTSWGTSSARDCRGASLAASSPTSSRRSQTTNASASGREIRRWQLHRWSGKTLADLARSINAVVQGWINYYGRFYRSELVRLLKRINEYLVRWARWKYKRLRRSPAKACRFLAEVYRREPDLFAHWRFGARPDGWTMGSRMTGDCHVRFCERRGVRLPPATHPGASSVPAETLAYRARSGSVGAEGLARRLAKLSPFRRNGSRFGLPLIGVVLF
jgi:RNA-directed DNA polymerase